MRSHMLPLWTRRKHTYDRANMKTLSWSVLKIFCGGMQSVKELRHFIGRQVSV